MSRSTQRYLLGVLFLFLAAAFAGVAVASALADAGARGWVTALAAAVIAAWLGSMALRALRPR
jgi:hypothetical protein